MQNETGKGPTRPDKTTERMAQERQSPGATSAGGQGADDGNTEARRGDTAATTAIDEARASPSEAPDAIDDGTPGASSQPREERIRETAYRISQSRGEFDGDAVSDWMQAEAEVDGFERDGGAAPEVRQ